MKYCRKFSDINMRSAGDFGGKTSSLGEMIQVGIPVPPGFGISTLAQKEFHDKPFSEDLKNEFKAMFKSLKLTRVAVRSSAIAEDSSDASWAGQLETYLNVELENIETAVRGCWKSIKSAQAIAYAVDKGMSEADLYVGVAVQKMVPSEVAGVMFTANPVTGDKNEIMIESLFGLGEMLVQGVVTPDRHIYNKSKGEVTEFDIEIKSSQMIYKDSKNIIEKLPLELGDKAALREEQVRQLSNIGLNIERHYRKPMDIEWAFENGKFYIVQARPVTTL